MFKKSIPVLMYHHVSPVGRELNVTPENFEDQMRFLRNRGWKTLLADEFLYLIQQNKVPNKLVLLTFDDGFADNYVYAYPVLKKYGMKAILFVTTSMIQDADIPRTNFLARPHKEAWYLATSGKCAEVMCTWNELKEMQDNMIFDIQSHGMTHDTPIFIREKKYAELRENLYKGKKTLESRLSKKVFHHAWPKGVYDSEAIDVAMNVGFKVLYTTERGANTFKNLNKIKRLPVKNNGGKWLNNKIKVYSSTFFTSIYLSIRTGV